jgi:TPR repeat protein
MYTQIKELYNDEKYDDCFKELTICFAEDKVQKEDILDLKILNNTILKSGNLSKSTIDWLKDRSDGGCFWSRRKLGYIYKYGYYVEKDPSRCVELYKKNTDIGTQFQLALMYKRGIGVEKDVTLALEMIRDSAEKGDGNAQYHLAKMYGTGKYLSQDYDLIPKRDQSCSNSANGSHKITHYKESMIWYQKCVEQGYYKGLIPMSYLYLKGLGVEKDVDKAIELLHEAHRKGDKRAIGSIANLYIKGKVVKQDLKKGIELYRQSDKNNKYTLRGMAGLYWFGTGVKKDYAKSFEFYCKAVKHGSIRSLNNMAFMYTYGYGVEKDIDKALEIYQQGVKRGDPHIMCLLGNIYRSGKIVTRDVNKAIELYKMAVEQKYQLAYIKLSFLYDSNIYSVKDEAKAFYWLNSCPDKDKSILGKIGFKYMRGEGVTIDKTIGFEYIKKAIDNGNTLCAIALADMYIKGNDIPKDINKGIQILVTLANQGHTGACVKLGCLYYDGKHPDQDYLVSFKWFNKIKLKKTNYYVRYKLAEMYRYGLGTTQNYRKAIELYRQNLNSINLHVVNRSQSNLKEILDSPSLQSEEEFNKMNIEDKCTFPQTVETFLKMEDKYIKKTTFDTLYNMCVGDMYIPKDILNIIVNNIIKIEK